MSEEPLHRAETAIEKARAAAQKVPNTQRSDDAAAPSDPGPAEDAAAPANPADEPAPASEDSEVSPQDVDRQQDEAAEDAVPDGPVFEGDSDENQINPA